MEECNTDTDVTDVFHKLSPAYVQELLQVFEFTYVRTKNFIDLSVFICICMNRKEVKDEWWKIEIRKAMRTAHAHGTRDILKYILHLSPFTLRKSNGAQESVSIVARMPLQGSPMIHYFKENGAKKFEYQKVFVYLPEKSKTMKYG